MAAGFMKVAVGSAAKNFANFNRRAPVALLGVRASHHAASYEDVLSVPEAKVTTLKNLLKVASEESNAPTATVGVYIDAGTRYENEKNNGVAHFIERLAFKGTSKKPQADLELDVEGNGLHLGSHVSRDQMGFYAKCLAKDVPKAVEILADVVQNASFSESEIEKEKANMAREFQEAENNLTTVVMDYLHATAYQGTPLGRSVLGSTNSIKLLKRADLQEFVSTNFKPPRMVLAATGGVKHDELVKLGEKFFSGMSLTYENEIPVVNRPRFTGSEMRHRDDDLPLAHVAIAIEGPGAVSGDNIAMSVATTLLGSWDRTYGAGEHLSTVLGSRCAQEELCHSFQSFNIAYRDTGLCLIPDSRIERVNNLIVDSVRDRGAHFVADRMTVEFFLFNLQEQWMRLCVSATDFEVERAKHQLKVDLFNQATSTTHNTDQLARQVLYYGRSVPLAELDARIDAVSAQSVRDAGMRYIYDKCPAVASIGCNLVNTADACKEETSLTSSLYME